MKMRSEAGFGLLAMVLPLSHVVSANAQPVRCAEAKSDSSVAGWNMVRLGDAWSGVNVTYPAIKHKGNIYFGFYDADRRLSVAKYDPKTKRLCVGRIGSVFAGWDSHNGIAMAFDAQDRLHIAGNMHVSPLIYARATSPNSVDSFVLQKMVGTEENRTTYPRFDHDNSGRLIFIYRSGGSGDGKWIINVLHGTKWSRVNASAFLADHDQEGPLSAYPTDFVRGDDGTFHLAIVWRRKSDPATNFLVSYASTRDFKNWYGAGGRRIGHILDPKTAETVDHVGANGGLVTKVGLSLDQAGTPKIAYSKYTADGHNSLSLASFSSGRWTSRMIAKSDNPNKVSSRANAMRSDVVRFAQFDAKGASIIVTFPDEKPRKVGFQSTKGNASPSHGKGRRVQGPPIPAIPKGLLQATLRRVAVLEADGKPSEAVIQYFAQSAKRDRAIDCTKTEARACAPPASPILLMWRR
ncbi:BNR repeat-containing protein [Sphingobium sp. AntQ-1]|uniref:BNR repeat-containing protein n=1 Tax=Sphingobium sp. AntQ-1 TaxID=2930091 RepID=UPI00234F999B|nr:BNR repeat-containing protein [Sphingobium sp. AntQ-1]